MKQIKLLMAALALIMGVSFTSCLDSGDSGDVWDLGGYMTVQQYMGSVTLLMDNGVIIYPTNSSDLILDTKNGTYPERVVAYCKLLEGDEFSENKKSYQAQVISWSQVPVKAFCTLPDTINAEKVIPLQSVYGGWAANGYINASFVFNYTGAAFDFELYPEAAENDKLTLRLKQTAGSAGSGQLVEYVYSFRQPSLSALQEQLEEMGLSQLTPVNDSISVTIIGTGEHDSDLKGEGANESFRMGFY